MIPKPYKPLLTPNLPTLYTLNPNSSLQKGQGDARDAVLARQAPG